jgi:hypothetical protein
MKGFLVALLYWNFPDSMAHWGSAIANFSRTSSYDHQLSRRLITDKLFSFANRPNLRQFKS